MWDIYRRAGIEETMKWLIVIVFLTACGDTKPPIEISYDNYWDCRADLYPDFGSDDEFDRIDELCGGPNEHVGPEPF